MPNKIDVSRVTWSNYENAVSEPDIVRIIDIAELFKVNIDDLIRIELSKNVDLLGKNTRPTEEKNNALIIYPVTSQEETNVVNEEDIGYIKTLKKELDLLILTQLNVIAADVKELREKLQ